MSSSCGCFIPFLICRRLSVISQLLSFDQRKEGNKKLNIDQQFKSAVRTATGRKCTLRRFHFENN
jgi:hypothetical protein